LANSPYVQKGLVLMENKNKNENGRLTRKQIEAVVLCSGEFGGMTVAQAAKKLNVSVQAINKRLKKAEQVCPQIFPLLTKREADVLALLNLSWSNDDIGRELDLPDYTVSKIIKSLQDKNRGVADSSPIIMQRYAPNLDSKVVRRF